MMRRLKLNIPVRVLSGSRKNKIETIRRIKKDFVQLNNTFGLSSRKKAYYIRINKSNIEVVV